MGDHGELVVLAAMELEEVYIIADMAIDAPAEDVWRIIGVFDNPSLGDGFLSSLTSNGEGVGALRTLHILPAFGGGTVVERQTARDDRGYYYAYELEDPGALPFVDYYASVQVAPASAKTCRVIWLNRYKTEAARIGDMRAQSLNLLQMIETNLNAELAVRRGRSGVITQGNGKGKSA